MRKKGISDNKKFGEEIDWGSNEKVLINWSINWLISWLIVNEEQKKLTSKVKRMKECWNTNKICVMKKLM